LVPSIWMQAFSIPIVGAEWNVQRFPAEERYSKS